MNPRFFAMFGAGVCFVVGACYYYFGSSHVSQNDPEVKQAISDAQRLLQTIRSERQRLLQPGEDAILSRGLASVTGAADAGQMKAGQENEIGKDPWGQSYRYRILVGTESSPEKAALWTAGKNKKFDAQFGDLKADLANEEVISLENDDFAVVLNL